MGWFDKYKPNKKDEIKKESNVKTLDIKGIDIKIDSETQFKKLGSETQVITIAKNLPKFELDQHQDKFNECLLKNNFHQSYQWLENKLYTNGLMAIGFEYPIDFLENEEYKYSPIIKFGRVINYKIENFQLTSLVIEIDTFMTGSIKYSIIEEYELGKKQNYIKAYAKNNYQIISDFKKIGYEYSSKLNIYSSFIPFVLFPNRYDEKDDLSALVGQEYLDALNIDFEAFIRDAFFSAPWIFYHSKGVMQQGEIEKAIWNFAKRIIKNNAASNILSDDQVKQLQAASNAQIIIQKIEKTIQRIKEFGFMKKNTQDLGTKNLQSDETQGINSDFDDYIETKANLREINFKKVVWLWQKILIHHEVLPSKEKLKIEVTVNGSTKYLEQQAKVIKVTQEGKLKNPTLVQINETKKKEGEDE